MPNQVRWHSVPYGAAHPHVFPRLFIAPRIKTVGGALEKGNEYVVAGKVQLPANPVLLDNVNNFRPPLRAISCLTIQSRPLLHHCSACHSPRLLISCPICNSFIRLCKSQPILFSTIPQPTQHCSCFHTLPVQSLRYYSLTLFVKKVLQAARPHSPPFLQSALRSLPAEYLAAYS
jgi:hypothetical protein